MKKIFLTFALTLFIAPFTVSAIELPYYTNANNIEMTREQYDRLVKVYGEETVNGMSQEIFDIEKDTILEEIDSKTIYVETKYRTSNHGIILGVEEREITEEEYENSIPSASETRAVGTYWETDYKKLEIKQMGANPGPDLGYTATKFILTNTWKSLPKVRSYDIMAFRYNNFNGDTSTFWGQLKYSVNGTPHIQSYGSSTPGFKSFSNGLGISMKLPEGQVVYLEGIISITGKETNMLTYGVYGTYQHAAKSITRELSTQYTINANGLGGVIKFNNSSTADYYDKMQGVGSGGLNFPG